MADEDCGFGDETRFPATYLEQLYGSRADIPMQQQGFRLNEILGTQRFEHDSWYLVTPQGVETL